MSNGNTVGSIVRQVISKLNEAMKSVKEIEKKNKERQGENHV